MSGARNALRGTLTEAFDQAWSLGLPPFIASIERSNPLNATPYICTFEELSARCAADTRRSQMIAATVARIEQAERLGIDVVFAIVGGSFLDPEIAAPNDFDCVCFYVARDVTDKDALAEQLGALQLEAPRASVDLRFLPYDGDPLLTAKMIGFFCVLYSRTRTVAAMSRGVLLLHRERHAAEGG